MSRFVAEASAQSLYCSFPACLENIEQLCQRVHAFLAAQGMNSQQFELLLVLRELVNNAVIHGSQLREDKLVRVELEVTDNTLHMDIEDQGPGFDWEKAYALAEADCDSCCGRGLWIVTCYTDGWAYNRRGNRVSITKKIP